MGRWLLKLAFAASVVSVALPASAAEVQRASISVLQEKPVLRQGRLLLQPELGSTVSDPLLLQFSAGGSLTWFQSERHALVGRYEWFDFGDLLGGTTAAYDDAISTTRVVPELSPIDWFGSVGYAFSPAYGKTALFGRGIAYYDIYGGVGVGAVHANGETSPAGELSLGSRVFVSKYLALDFQLRDRLQYRPVGGDDSLVQTVTIGLGVGLFLSPQPTTFAAEGAQ